MTGSPTMVQLESSNPEPAARRAAPRWVGATLSRRGRAIDRGRRGQSLVEFALVLPIFILVIIAFIEFAFAFSALNSLNFVARDIAQYAAEAGNTQGSDCSTLKLLENELSVSTSPSGLTTVLIYWSDGNGNIVNSAADQYSRTGSMTCTDVNGVSQTLPYTAVSATYADTTRCAVLLGCPSPPAAVNHPTLDTIGIQLTYTYNWKTPLATLLTFTSAPTFKSTQQVRIEPVL